MIVYNPSDPKADIIFNDRMVAWEKRNLITPTASFILGEWVGLDANKFAVKISSSGLATAIAFPAPVMTPTGRHDVAESEGITVARGSYWMKTQIYKLSESFDFNSQLVVVSDGGIGKLGKLPAQAGAYLVVGRVTKPPVVDGTDFMEIEVYANPMIVVVS